jgi:hypothetical protein
MNTRYTLGNPIREKTKLGGEAYALLSFLQLWNADTKKEALTMEVHLTLRPIWLLQKLLLLCYSPKIPLLDALLNYGTTAMLNNGTLSPYSGLVFNIA